LSVITGAYLIVFALALGLALLLTPLAIWMARRFGVVAAAGGRRINEGDRRGVPKLGGVVLYGSFITAVIAAQLLPVPRDDPKEIIRLVGLIAGATVMFVAGVLDDARELRPIPQFMAQFLAAAIAILFQIFIEFFNNPLSGQQTDAWPFVVTVTLTFFWLVGMMNTVNWLDGLDGLAAGVGLIAGTMLFINSAFEVQPPQTSVSLLPLALMGACLGFLLFNFYPARQFLGGGAPLLGFILGTLSIIGGAKMAAILLVMGLPLLDAGWQVVSRVLRGQSPFSGDRGHIHFRLLDMGFSQRQIVVTYYLFCAFFGALTLLVESQLYKFIAFGVMALLVAIGIVVLLRSQRQNAS
jgi:UDP-GlcNAc:undecaprenyl-phosphate/decaprenyl-phosphate GlcNAc-1-phosphate transferase